MKIHEYQAKELLAQYGLPIPPGQVATTPEEARAAASQIGGTVVVKAQVLVGGRGKAGGVKLAATPDEAAAKAAAILGMDIKGITVQRVLVAQAVDIASEIYLGVILDRAAKAITIMASAEGAWRSRKSPARRRRRFSVSTCTRWPDTPITRAGNWPSRLAYPQTEPQLCRHRAHARAGAHGK